MAFYLIIFSNLFNIFIYILYYIHYAYFIYILLLKNEQVASFHINAYNNIYYSETATIVITCYTDFIGTARVFIENSFGCLLFFHKTIFD